MFGQSSFGNGFANNSSAFSGQSAFGNMTNSNPPGNTNSNNSSKQKQGNNARFPKKNGGGPFQKMNPANKKANNSNKNSNNSNTNSVSSGESNISNNSRQKPSRRGNFSNLNPFQRKQQQRPSNVPADHNNVTKPGFKPRMYAERPTPAYLLPSQSSVFEITTISDEWDNSNQSKMLATEQQLQSNMQTLYETVSLESFL